MKNKKRIISAALAGTLLLSSVSFAKDLDIKNNTTKEISPLLEIMNAGKLLEVYNNKSNFLIEVGEKFYNVADVDAATKDGTPIIDAVKNLTPVLDEEEKLSVESVSAINKTTVKVTFNKEVDAIAASNFTAKVGGVTKTIDTVGLDSTKKVATLTIQGLEYKDDVTVTVSGVKAGTSTVADSTQIVKVPSIGDLFELKITSDDEDGKIVADGATKTMVTAELIEKATGLAKDVDGTVTFTTTKGAFAQGQVALQDGKASVQLTSAASDETTVAYINAVVSDVPGATEYEGLAGSMQVIFVPEGTNPDEVSMVQATYAESNQADRIFVTFSGKITRDTIIGTYAGSTDAAKLAAAQADNFGFRVDGTQAVKDIKQKSDDVLELILDVDNQASTTMLQPGVGATTEGYLRDNITHNVSIPANLGTKVVMNTTGINFKLTDAKKPSIFGVTVEDNLKLRVRFSEAMAEDIVEATVVEDGHNINNHFRIDGRRVMMTAGINASAAEKLYASSKNLILANSLYVSADDVNQEGYISADKDTREIVTINLDKSSRLSTGTYSLQAANVGDWAAMTDPANMVATQTFDFSVVEDTTKPTAKVEVQSPEQWLVTFSQTVNSITGKNAEDVFKIYKADDYAKDPKVTLAYGVDYQVKEIDANGYVGTNVPAGAPVPDGKTFLVEFKGDWTENALAGYDTIGTGINYFHSTKNPYKVAIASVENNSGNVIDSTVLDVSLLLDGTSPTIANAQDVNDFSATETTKNGITTANAGEYVYVKMSEPVKMNLPGITPTEGLTPSQQQTAGAGVPVPTFEFVKGDKTVNGQLASGSLAEDDQSFVVEPVDPLEAGTWTLYIRSISDDVGNTSPTAQYNVVVKAGAVVESDTRVSWAGFDNNTTVGNTPGVPAAGSKDYIYIKFTKPMKNVGPNAVSATTNYIFKGVELPEGSTITKGIKNVTNDWDGVTISMPQGTWNGLSANNVDFTNVLNVANNFESTGGEKLAGPYEIQLQDTSATSTADNDMILEAFYANANAASMLGGSAVTSAEVSEGTVDGKIDTVKLNFSPDSETDIDANTEIKINGKTFITLAGSTAGDSDVTFTNKAASDLIDSTDASNLVITKDGAIIINTSRVIDDAGPVVKKAELSSDKKKLTVTMSENVSKTQNGIFTALATGDFTFTGAATYTLATDGHKSESADTLVFDVTGAAPVSTDTIKANATVFDMNINTLVGPAGTLANPADQTIAATAINGGIAATGITGLNVETTAGVAPTAAVTAVQGVDTITFGGTFVSGDVITIDGQILVTGAGTTATAKATEVVALIAGNATLNAKYTVADNSAGELTLTEKAGQEDPAVVTVATNSTAGTTVAASTTAGVTGVPSTLGTAEVNTLTISGPATAAGNITVTFNDGGTPVVKTIAVTNAETAASIAAKINTEFATGLTGWTATNTPASADVVFTANAPAADKTVTITVSNS